MKRIYLLFCWMLCAVTLSAQTKQTADEAYGQEKYRQAIEMYEQLLATQGASADVYYNLGNSYFKTKEYAKAILNYERALLLNPGDEDTLHNLEVAKSKTIDKIVPKNRTFIALWWDNLIGAFHETTWATCAIVSFLLFLTGCLIYSFMRRVRWRKWGFFGGCVALVVCLFANYAAYVQARLLTHPSAAIIMKPSVIVKSTPSATGTDLFILHEGTKVKIEDGISQSWCEVSLPDGKKGWIPFECIEKI